MASTLTLHHISPAAKRLIIRLLFGVLVMQPDLNRGRVSSRYPRLRHRIDKLDPDSR